MSKQLKDFIQNQDWIFAKTYSETWPHEYIVQEQVDNELFLELAGHIDKFGFEDYFYVLYRTSYKIKQSYFEYDSFTYWHMENIINRCKEKDTFRYRKRMGLLPEDKRKN